MSEELTPGTTTQNGLVAMSDFSYEPPSNEKTFNLKAAEKNFIDQLLAGVEPEREEPVESGGDELPPEFSDDFESPETVSEEAGTEPVEAEEEVEQEDPRSARGFSRLVQREVAAKSREDAAVAAEKRAEARIAELKKYENLKPTADLAEMGGHDPLGVITTLGLDPDSFIKLSLAQQLGDAAPDKLKEFARGASERREIAKIRAELAAERQARAAAEYFNTISAGARAHVTKNLGDPKAVKAYPSLSKAAKVDPQYVHDEIMEEIVKEARIKATTDPNGEPISYDEAAKRVEARLARIAKLINGPSMAGAAPRIVQKPNGTSPPTTKPAAKPLSPWHSRSSNIEEEGIREALAVYERAEAERKARRK